MRKDSLFIFSISIVLTLGIVGGMHYLYLQKQKHVPNPVFNQKPTAPQPARSTGNAVRPANRRTSTIIMCTQANGSVFYTNAAGCDDADLGNRLSYADPVKPVPRVRLTDNRKSSKSGSNTKRLKSIPWNMPKECKFPVGKAQEIEKDSLRLKDNPAESIWKDSYCRWVCEARVENCKNLSEYLNLVRLCPRRANMSKRSCRT